MKNALTDTQTELHQKEFHGRYTHCDHLHLTLSFIGEYSDPDGILEIMEQVRCEPVKLTLSGYIGNFGETHRKKVCKKSANCGKIEISTQEADLLWEDEEENQ